MSKLEFLREMQTFLQNNVNFHADALRTQQEKLDAVNSLIEDVLGKDTESQTSGK